MQQKNLGIAVLALLVLGGCQHPTLPSPDADWTNASPVTLRAWPTGDVDRRTDIRVRYDADSFSVRVICLDDYILTPVAGRDSDIFKGDVVEFFIDPLGTGQTMVEIQINPNNDVLDLLLNYDENRELTAGGRLTEDSVQKHYHSDRAFNLDHLQTAAGRTADGYWVELRIPFESLCRAVKSRSINFEKMRWNVIRLDHKQNGPALQTSLVRIDPGCQHISPERTLPIRAKASPAH